MTNVLTFKVEVEGLENKIWRIIETTDKRTVADLAYTILTTFDSLAYHLYAIYHGYDRYDCMIDPIKLTRYNFKDAVATKLEKIDFSANNKMTMEYDFGSTNTFIITLIKTRQLEKYNANHYPYIIDGKGRGILDDISSDDLKEIVNDIDKKGKSNHDFTPGYERPIKYDYRNYNIKTDNYLLKGEMSLIKDNYERYY
jgi:hypothetical protein